MDIYISINLSLIFVVFTDVHAGQSRACKSINLSLIYKFALIYMLENYGHVHLSI